MLGTAEKISEHTAAAIPATIKIKTAIPAAEGEGKTKKQAEQAAALAALKKIQDQ